MIYASPVWCLAVFWWVKPFLPVSCFVGWNLAGTGAWQARVSYAAESRPRV